MRRTIGVSLSGGGHRAALFGLGVLLYLADVGRNKDVVAIASVSGGSLTNAYVAQTGGYAEEESGADFWQHARPFAQQLAQRGTLLPPSPVTAAYLILFAIVLLATVIGTWFLPVHWLARVGLFLLGLVILGALARLRGHVAARAFASTLFSTGEKPTPLALDRTPAVGERFVDHIICATDLHAGENVYFSRRFVCSYRYGWGRPGDLPLHVPVQVSCGLPPAFPPRWLPTKPHSFKFAKPAVANTQSMVLVDGGVYDNMADQWFLGMEERRKRFKDQEPSNDPARPNLRDLLDAEDIIVVNSSAGLDWEPVSWWLRAPLIGEVVSLIRDTSILYDNGNTVRRRLLFSRYQHRELVGAFVDIAKDPFYIPEKFEGSSDPGYAERADEVLALLAGDATRLKQVALDSKEAKTSLTRMRSEAAADIIEHGYVLALANLHVLLGYGCDTVPSRDMFDDLVSVRPKERGGRRYDEPEVGPG